MKMTVSKPDSPLVQYFLIICVLLSVAAYIVEVDIDQSSNSLEGNPVWLWLERFFAAIFTLEIFWRVRKSFKNDEHYCHAGMFAIDLLAVIPFYVGFFVPASWLGIVHTLRVLRLLKFYRYSEGMRCFITGLCKSWRMMRAIGVVVTVLILFGSVVIYELEGTAQPDSFKSLSDAIWWAFVTMTTVGYGDMYPVTVMGRIFAVFFMCLGIGVMASLIGIVGNSVYDELKTLNDN
jgi:voltage-gated potassium channel